MCPINGSKCLRHTKFDFKFETIFFHFFVNFVQAENFESRYFVMDWQTSSVTFGTVDWWMLNVLSVIQNEPVSFKYFKRRNYRAKKMSRFDWLIYNCKGNWETSWYQLKENYYNFHVCFKSLIQSTLKSFFCFKCLKLKKSRAEKKL